jgi:tetratricopeptide (TPR) repeat protein
LILRDRPLVPLACLAALVALAFASGVDSGMVLDNAFIVAGDPRTQHLSWSNLQLIFTQDYWYPRGVGGLYRPFTTLSYAFNYSLLGNGTAPLGYHLVNMVLHFANVSLAFALLERSGVRRWTAAAVAGAFAVHPVVVESVTNIVGRADLLAAAALLGGLHLHATLLDDDGHVRVGRLALLALVTLVGVLCKENVAILVALILLWDVTLHLRRTDRGWTHDVVALMRRRTLFGWSVIVPVLAVVFMVRRALMEGWALPPMAVIDNPLRSADVATQELTALKVLFRSVGLMLFPLRLSCDYSFDQVPLATPGDVEVWGGLAMVAALAGLATWARNRQRALVFLIGFFVVTLLPTSNVLVVIDSMMSERFLYLPLLGLVGTVGVAVEPFLRTTSVRGSLAATVIVLLTARTAVRNRDWLTNLTLWTSASQVTPESFRVHKSLAWTLFTADERLDHGGGDRIIAELERALEILLRLPAVDRDKSTYLYLGMVARAEGDRRARSADPTGEAFYAKALHALEEARTIDRLMNTRHVERERDRGRAASEIRDVGQPRIYQELGDVLAHMGRTDDALDAYRDMVHLAPEDPTGILRIATTEMTVGRRDAAAVALMELVLMGESGPEVGDAVLQVYEGVDCGAAAPVTKASGSLALNETCPIVRDHFCAAIRELERTAAEAKLARRVAWARQLAADRRCPRPPTPRKPGAEGGSTEPDVGEVGVR